MKTTNNIPAFFAQFIGRPVLISDVHMARMSTVMRDRMDVFASVDCSQRAGGWEEYLEGVIPPVAKYRKMGNAAIIPVHGAITRGTSELERLVFGLADIDLIAEDIQKAKADESVDVVAFDFNTPGGSVSQVPETADMIAGIGKPTVAIVDELCASAGQWLAAACDMTAATRSAELGSIGVYAGVYDLSGLYESLGVSVEVFKSGKYKAAGLPGTSLTDEQREMMQQSVDETFADFKAFIHERKGNVPDEAMQGQCFSAVKAIGYGLCNELISSKNQAFLSL